MQLQFVTCMWFFHFIHLLNFVFVVVCILAGAMSSRNNEPWTVAMEVIDLVECQVELREDALNDVTQAMKKKLGDRELSMCLAEIVDKHVSSLSL